MSPDDPTTGDPSTGTASSPEADSAATGAAPFLRVVRGNPTDEELAALVSVLAASASGGGAPPAAAGPRDNWGSLDQRLRSVWGGAGAFINGPR